jgi:hypothetical protein
MKLSTTSAFVQPVIPTINLYDERQISVCDKLLT